IPLRAETRLVDRHPRRQRLSDRLAGNGIPYLRLASLILLSPAPGCDDAATVGANLQTSYWRSNTTSQDNGGSGRNIPGSNTPICAQRAHAAAVGADNRAGDRARMLERL